MSESCDFTLLFGGEKDAPGERMSRAFAQPSDAQRQIVAALRKLPNNDARLDVFGEFCQWCGSVDPLCPCTDDS